MIFCGMFLPGVGQTVHDVPSVVMRGPPFLSAAVPQSQGCSQSDHALKLIIHIS